MFGIEFFPLIENLLDLLFGSFFMLRGVDGRRSRKFRKGFHLSSAPENQR
jgi:hypothetical protein